SSDLDDLAAFRRALPAGLLPFQAIERQNADSALLADKAAGLASGLQPDARRLITDLQHHGKPPRDNVGQYFDFGKLDAPISGDVDFGHRSAPTLRLVEAHQAVDHGLARQDLQLRIKRRTDRQ